MKAGERYKRLHDEGIPEEVVILTDPFKVSTSVPGQHGPDVSQVRGEIATGPRAGQPIQWSVAYIEREFIKSV